MFYSERCGEVQYSLVFSKARPDGGAEVGGCLGVEAGRGPLCDYISQVPSPPVWNNIINGTTLSAPGGLRFQTPQTFSQRLHWSQASFPVISTLLQSMSVSSGVLVMSVAFLNQGLNTIFCLQTHFKPVWSSTDTFSKIRLIFSQ